MTYSDYQITIEEFHDFHKSKIISGRIKEIWNDLLTRIKKEDLKAEAEDKGFEIVDNPDIEDDPVADYKRIIIPDGSEELKKYLEDELYSYIVCLKIWDEEGEDEEYY